jgi:hypothetical protein
VTDLHPGLRARRIVLCVLIACFFAVVGGLSVGLIPFERYWVRLQIKVLPGPSETFLIMAEAVRSPWGAALCGATMLLSMVAVWQGQCDSRSGVLTLVVLCLTFIVSVWFVAAIYLPTFRSHGPRSPLLD